MLNIRTIGLFVVLALILTLTVQLVTAGTETTSTSANEANVVPEHQVSTAGTRDTYSLAAYRSQFGECFDVSIRDLATCRTESQASVYTNHPRLDECFDEALMEEASCRNESQVSALK